VVNVMECHIKGRMRLFYDLIINQIDFLTSRDTTGVRLLHSDRCVDWVLWAKRINQMQGDIPPGPGLDHGAWVLPSVQIFGLDQELPSLQRPLRLCVFWTQFVQSGFRETWRKSI
jgi:hypothetical protein